AAGSRRGRRPGRQGGSLRAGRRQRRRGGCGRAGRRVHRSRRAPRGSGAAVHAVAATASGPRPAPRCCWGRLDVGARGLAFSQRNAPATTPNVSTSSRRGVVISRGESRMHLLVLTDRTGGGKSL